jgi:hypothetical protein
MKAKYQRNSNNNIKTFCLMKFLSDLVPSQMFLKTCRSEPLKTGIAIRQFLYHCKAGIEVPAKGFKAIAACSTVSI